MVENSRDQREEDSVATSPLGFQGADGRRRSYHLLCLWGQLRGHKAWPELPLPTDQGPPASLWV